MIKFLKLSTWKAIILSRIQYRKNSKTEWAKERLKTCSTCPYNSKFKKPQTGKEYFYKYLNLAKEHCTACGCPIKYKVTVSFNSCGLEEIGKEPKWNSL